MRFKHVEIDRADIDFRRRDYHRHAGNYAGRQPGSGEASRLRESGGFAGSPRSDFQGKPDRLSGVNYFFRLTTIISPDQRQLLS